MPFFLITGGTKRVMARNRSVRGDASRHISEREDSFCLYSCTNDWVRLAIAQGQKVAGFSIFWNLDFFCKISD